MVCVLDPNKIVTSERRTHENNIHTPAQKHWSPRHHDESSYGPLFAAAEFYGFDYQEKRDRERLTGQIRRIYDLMSDGQWRTLRQIEDATGDPAASISAQLRNLRKPSFGRHIVEREHLGDGLYAYRLLLVPERQAAAETVMAFVS